MICIGDWRRNISDPSKVFRYDSGHHNNVFQAKPMPHSGDRLYVTCAADGQVSKCRIAVSALSLRLILVSLCVSLSYRSAA